MKIDVRKDREPEQAPMRFSNRNPSDWDIRPAGEGRIVASCGQETFSGTIAEFNELMKA
jgi:hypothetical protein